MPTTDISTSTIDQIRSYMLSTFGLNFNGKRDVDLLRNISLAAQAFHFSDIPGFINWLTTTPINDAEQGKLASFFTIGETYFFREKKSFDFLEQIYLPGLIFKRQKQNRILRIWSAGCAGGEEAYSIAILLHRVIPKINEWNITILASDLNPDFLEKAKKGIYTRWSFRNLPKQIIDNYFIPKGQNEFQIIPEIRKMVTFSKINLNKEVYPNEKTNTLALDVVFCRNVLIYFSQQGIRDVSNRFYNSLNKGGLLLVSPVEMSDLISSKFEKINYAGFTIYQKGQIENFQPGIIQNHQIVSKPTQVFNHTSVLPTKPIKKEITLKPANGNTYKEIEPTTVLFEKAVQLFHEGHFENAEEILTKLTPENEKERLELDIYKTKTLANQGKLMDSLELCNSILIHHKTLESILFLKASILMELENYTDALASLKKALYLNPKFILAHFTLGNLELKAGKKEEGMKHFKNAFSILSKIDENELVPESDGLTAKRLKEIISAIKN